MGSRGSGFNNTNNRQYEDDDWWKQQDADKVAEEQAQQAEEEAKSGTQNLEVVSRYGVYYYVDADGDMWPMSLGTTKPSERDESEEEPEQEQSDNPDPFSQERKDSALWTTNKWLVDSVLRPESAKLYPNFDNETKQALQSYTGSGYVSINSALGNDSVGDGYLKNKIDKLTDALDKSELPVDMWLQRGVERDAATHMFGDNFTVESIQKMIDNGDIITNKPFMSTSGAKGAGFAHKPVILNIYAPKGTKALYAEPFAVHGWGKYNWDGKLNQSHFSGEFEVLVQRGAQMRPLKVTENNGKIYVDLQIEGFNY